MSLKHNSFDMVPTATPSARPFSMHDASKVVTDSAQRKLDRKRANARIRQQRCRARKRARAQQEEAKTFEEQKKVRQVGKESRLPLPPLKKGDNLKKDAKAPVTINGSVSTGIRYWQPPPPMLVPGHPHPPKPTKNIHKLAKVPRSITNNPNWKPPPQAPASYPTASSYYTHHPHAASYGMPWYGAWSQAAAAAYYSQNMHMHPHHPQAYSQPHPSNTASTAPAPKLPPASPLQLISPMRNDASRSATTEVTEATTPYHEVEDMVKSPLRSLTSLAATPLVKDSRGAMSPQPEFLPPLWSTESKPTPNRSARSPWSLSLPSPSIMTATPAANSQFNWSTEYHDTPSLPLTTPIKTSNEMLSWAASPTLS